MAVIPWFELAAVLVVGLGILLKSLFVDNKRLNKIYHAVGTVMGVDGGDIAGKIDNLEVLVRELMGHLQLIDKQGTMALRAHLEEHKLPKLESADWMSAEQREFYLKHK